MGSIADPSEGTTYDVVPVGVPEPGTAGPERLAFALEPVRPNPLPAARGAVTVRFALPSDEPTRLDIFDVRGRWVAGRDVGALGEGAHTVEVDLGSRVAPGVYVVRLTAGVGIRTIRMVVL